MKIINYKEVENYYILRFENNTQGMIDKYPQIKDYKNHGFDKIEDMMLEISKGNLWFDKIKKTEHKIYKNDYNFNTIRINELKEINLKPELVADFLEEDEIFESYVDFYHYIKNINIKDFYNVDTKYKTKLKINDKFLNVIDLTKLYLNNYNSYIALNFIADLMKIVIVEREIIDFQERIILNNLKTDLKEVLNKKSYDFISNYLEVLEKIYNIALLHLIPITNLKNESVFYFSNRYLAKKTNRSEASINYIINTFAALGFIKKINKKDLGNNFIDKSREYKENDMFYEVSFYSIEKFDINYIEKNIEIMIDKKSSFSKITEKEVKRLFGKERANLVFPNVKISKKTINKRLNTKNMNVDITEDDKVEDIIK